LGAYLGLKRREGRCRAESCVRRSGGDRHGREAQPGGVERGRQKPGGGASPGLQRDRVRRPRGTAGRAGSDGCPLDGRPMAGRRQTERGSQPSGTAPKHRRSRGLPTLGRARPTRTSDGREERPRPHRRGSSDPEDPEQRRDRQGGRRTSDAGGSPDGRHRARRSWSTDASSGVVFWLCARVCGLSQTGALIRHIPRVWLYSVDRGASCASLCAQTGLKRLWA
jgi:hypothetical protein